MRTGGASGSAWDKLRYADLALPAWYRTDLDPWSDDYLAQQTALWRAVAGIDRAYAPEQDELPHDYSTRDPVRLPGFYFERDPMAVQRASDHLIATGMILQQSGLRPGQWALEYGAGFANSALTLARLGVNVDTVDISEMFCELVRKQADFFEVPLTPFVGQFGLNPRGDQRYDLIWFYESFHHCLDFQNVVHQIKAWLKPEGRILLVGEPIPRVAYSSLPYPWGIRLHSEVVAMIRQMHWCELGFTQDFLLELFTRAGFKAARFECAVSPFGVGFDFRHRDELVDLATDWMTPEIEATWHGREPNGRWTTASSTLPLDTSDSFDRLEIAATNFHPKAQAVAIEYGGQVTHATLQPGESRTLQLDAARKSPRIALRCDPLVPAQLDARSADTRPLGIFVTSVRYCRDRA